MIFKLSGAAGKILSIMSHKSLWSPSDKVTSSEFDDSSSADDSSSSSFEGGVCVKYHVSLAISAVSGLMFTCEWQ